MSDIPLSSLISEALRDYKKYKELADLLNQLVISVYKKDRSGAYLVYYGGFLSALGLRSDEVVGMNDIELSKKLNYPLSYAENLMSHDQKVMESGQATENEIEHYPNRNGGETWLLSTKIPIFENGQCIGLVGFSMPTTYTKLQEIQEKDMA